MMYIYIYVMIMIIKIMMIVTITIVIITIMIMIMINNDIYSSATRSLEIFTRTTSTNKYCHFQWSMACLVLWFTNKQWWFCLILWFSGSHTFSHYQRVYPSKIGRVGRKNSHLYPTIFHWLSMDVSLQYIYIYIYICMYMYIYMYI